MGTKGNRPERGAKRNGARRLGLVDLDTGEPVEDGLPVWVPRKFSFGEDFMLVLQRALVEIAEDREAGYEATRVLLHLMGTASFENWVRVNQTEVGARLGIKRQNVGRALRSLVAKGYLERAEATINGSHIYRVNKTMAWKGKGRNWLKAARGDKAPPHLKLVKGSKKEG